MSRKGEELTGKQIHYGAMAKAAFRAGENPPSWVADEATWDKAKTAASKTYDMDDDAFWPVVVSIYENMGGDTKEAKARRHVAAMNQICARRMAGNKALEASIKENGFSVQDMQCEVSEALSEHALFQSRMALDGPYEPACCWVCDIVAPAHESGEVWTAIARGADGKTYAVGFQIDGDHEVRIVESMVSEVEQTTDWEHVEAEARAAEAKGALQAEQGRDPDGKFAGGGHDHGAGLKQAAKHASDAAEAETDRAMHFEKHEHDGTTNNDEAADLHDKAAQAHGSAADAHKEAHAHFSEHGDHVAAKQHDADHRDHVSSQQHHEQIAEELRRHGHRVNSRKAGSKGSVQASNPEGINQYSHGQYQAAHDASHEAREAHRAADKASRAASQSSPEGKAAAHKAAGEAYEKASELHDAADKAHMHVGNGKMAMEHAEERVHTHNMGILHHSAAEKYGSGKASEIAKAKEMESKAAETLGAVKAGDFHGNQHHSPSDLADEHSVAAKVASRQAMKASRDADDADGHHAAHMAHHAAKAAHELAAEKHKSAGNDDDADDHMEKANGHGQKAAEHLTKHEEMKASMYARYAGPGGIECHLSQFQADAYASDPAADNVIMYMPGGVHEITPSQDGEAVDVTVLVDAKSADAIEKQRQALTAAGKKPFLSIQHSTEIAAAWPLRFFWAERVDCTGATREGVWAEVEWTKSGLEAVRGKDFRSFSPTFFVDRLRTSRDNPAKVVCNVGARANMGALENDPAFQEISPLWARNAGATGTTANNEGEDTMENQQTTAELQAQLQKLEQQAVVLKPKTDEVSKAQLRACNAEIREIKSELKAMAAEARSAGLEAADTNRKEKLATEAVEFMVGRGDINIRDENAQQAWHKRFANDEELIGLICGDMKGGGAQASDGDPNKVNLPNTLLPGVRNIIRNMPATGGPGQPQVLARSNGTGALIQARDAQVGRIGYGSGFSVSGAMKAYFQLVCRNKDTRWQEDKADNYKKKGIAALEAASLWKSDLEPNSAQWENLPIAEIGRMIGLEAADFSNTNLGVLSGTLVLQRTLPFFKYKYPELLNLYTDFSDTPGLLNQAENTRIVIQPAVQKYNTALDSAGRPQGWSTVSAAKTKDVTLTLTDYVAVPIVFGNDILASTVRRLFDEQAVLAVNALAGYFIGLLTNLFTAANYNAYAVQNGTLVPQPYVTYVKDLQSFSMADLDNLDAIFTSNQVPEEDRGVMLNPLYYAKLRGDPRLEFLYMGAGGRSAESAGPWLTEARLPKLSGFAPYKAPYLPSSIPTTNPSTNNVVGMAFQKAGAVLKSRLPQDFTQALGVLIPGSVTTITDPDTKISIMLVQYINLTSGYAEWRPEVMLGAALGDSRAGLVITSQ